MKSKIVLNAVFTLGVMAIACTAYAGREGNGGGGYICPNPGQSEFLDLFEAKLSVGSNGLGLNILASNDSVDTQIQNAFNRLNPNSGVFKKVMQVYAEVKAAKINLIDPNAQISWPQDEKNTVDMNGCQRKGIMLYTDSDNSILQDQQTLLALPATQQAAAWVHETIYKLLRETQGDTDSVRARKIVGYLFSDASDAQIESALMLIDPQLINVENKKLVWTRDGSGIDIHLSVSQTIYLHLQESDPACSHANVLISYLGKTYKGKTDEDIEMDINPYATRPSRIVMSVGTCRAGSMKDYSLINVFIKGSRADITTEFVSSFSHDTKLPDSRVFDLNSDFERGTGSILVKSSVW